MKMVKFLMRDIKLGIIHRWYIMFLPVIFSIAQVLQCHKIIDYFMTEKLIYSSGTVMDYYIYSMQGMPIYHFSSHDTFSIPIYWFVFQIGISYFIAYYASNDLHNNGRSIFLASKSRTAWWTSKCVWCFCSVLLYYITAAVTILLSSCLMGADISLDFSQDFGVKLFGSNMMYVSSLDMICISILLPLFMTFAICMIQLVLGFFISPVISFAVACGIYVLSAYYTEWFFFGNFTMWLRNSYVYEEGLSPLSGAVLVIFAVVFSYVGGYMYFNRKDVL